jgi:hypothetical protein
MGGPPPSPPVVGINCPGYDPVGTSRTFIATTNVSCSIAICLDGVLKVSGSGTSLAYNAGAGILGHHIVRAIASNAEGSSDAVCDWYVYNPDACDPLGPFIKFPVYQWRPNSSSEWQNATCTQNTAINFAYTGNSAPFSSILANCQWRRNENCAEQPFLPVSPVNKDVFVVGRWTPDLPDPEAVNHAMVAEYLGGSGGYTNWSNWRFFQYGDLNIQKGEWPEHYQMPYPINENGFTRVQIKRVTGFSDCIHYQDVIIVTFKILHNGTVELW